MTRYLSDPKGRTVGPYDLFTAGRPVWNLVKSVAQRIRHRRAVTTLLNWDERALRDIGLTRADVQLSLALPYRDDPSTQLMFWALERRSARLMQRRELDGWTARLSSGLSRTGAVRARPPSHADRLGSGEAPVRTCPRKHRGRRLALPAGHLCRAVRW